MKINFYIIFSFFSILSFAQNNRKTLDIKSIETLLLILFLPDHEVYTSDKEYLKNGIEQNFMSKVYMTIRGLLLICLKHLMTH